MQPRHANQRPRSRKRRTFYHRRKVCRFCVEHATDIDYKDTRVLKNFVTDRGKIIPRRISGTCARHQRRVTQAIKRARYMALMPYTAMTPNRS